MDVDSLKQLLEQRFDGQDKTLERIETQTKLTNGRVTALERAQAVQSAVLAAIVTIVIGTVAVLGFLGMIHKPGDVVVSPPSVIR